MEVLVLDGKNYVKASKAAKDLGYATDYVGQLCRSGQVDSHLIGRTWYVNQEELSTHKVEKKRTSRVKAREYAKKTIEEYRTQNAQPKKIYNSVPISYEQDTEALIPETRRVAIVSEKEKKHFDTYSDEGDKKEVVNKGAKVLMEGSLNVVDVTDGEVDDSTTVLKPKIFAGTPEPTKKKRVIDDIPVAETPAEVIVPIKKSFIEKLEAKDVHADEHTSDVDESSIEVDPNQQTVTPPTTAVTIGNSLESKDISFTASLSIIIVSLALVLVTLPLSKVLTYTKDGVSTVSVTTTIKFSARESLERVSEFTK